MLQVNSSYDIVILCSWDWIIKVSIPIRIERCRKLPKLQNLRPDSFSICCSFPYWKYTQMPSLHDPTRVLVTFHFGTITVSTCVVRNTGLREDVRCDIHAINDISRDNFHAHYLTENLHFSHIKWTSCSNNNANCFFRIFWLFGLFEVVLSVLPEVFDHCF